MLTEYGVVVTVVMTGESGGMFATKNKSTCIHYVEYTLFYCKILMHRVYIQVIVTKVCMLLDMHK